MSRDNGLTVGLGMVVGLVAGAVAGILFAPATGEESRKKVKEALEEYKNNLPDEVANAKKAGLDSLEKLKYSLESQIQKVNDHIKAKKLASAKEKENEGCGMDYQGE